MNLLLFEPGELSRPLPADDPRARHLRGVLRREPGGSFDCGLVDGPRGRGFLEGSDEHGLHLRFEWGSPPPPLCPIWLLVGLPRPQTVRKVLLEATTLGAERILFFSTDRGEPSYADSSLWSSGEVRRHLLAGAAQAFCTRLPTVSLLDGIHAALDAASAARTRLALDNYEAAAALSALAEVQTPAALAVGPERGWSPAERDALRAAGCTLAHLGPRVLRTETACTAGLAILKSRLGLG
jgi:16S rRNA (uracil1498-N3)-methyltransferase